ncbi:MAG: hypothetical protein RBT71_10865 [Flavobacteriales bacterium]|jgi:hypothetical protein|nr:hypothetical protein [Flavobacteriales bacterium]
MPHRLLIVHATCGYVLAFLLTTFLHEFAHALAGLCFGSGPVLHHHHVRHLTTAHLGTAQSVAIALAGPAVSLLQGLLTARALRRSNAPHGPARLFLQWLAWLGLANALGYLMTGLLFTAGDIGKAYALLGAPWPVRIGLALAGAGALAFAAYRLTRPFLAFAATAAELATPEARARHNGRAIILPWLLGSAVMTLLYLPVVAVVSIIYPVMSGMVLIFPWQQARREADVRPMGDPALRRGPWRGVLLVVLAAAVFRLVLVPGVAL